MIRVNRCHYLKFLVNVFLEPRNNADMTKEILSEFEAYHMNFFSHRTYVIWLRHKLSNQKRTVFHLNFAADKSLVDKQEIIECSSQEKSNAEFVSISPRVWML